ncbi:competence protein CoiA family protein [Bacillus swezeyi]|uniref:Competence protein CoiA n=1 Tax=Bacillus swezeyi TaxID=1925020 RepID=A0A1R1S0H7_9BACI|nr:competence protein CoiA family protein [Bacillus swezeyi]MEC1261525.1 competence protein CoiA family protein [Bacillus swezeyi]MED2926612.1 competence protein CoiA family protein [Bacillus swezeyi]MED2944083.1 competence protein CoiA family protein [Bacillus swezeyi]MED2965826.1 competence protein CoiA family protein [Bacillus swezeyi]MED2978446.1 competence protein CoiA family protein [Bacillus swezeyi]
MFSAQSKEGRLICLADGYRADELKRMRERHTFYCPACHHKLDLKIGAKKLHHFAHKPGSACPVPHEPESLYHLKGKRLLYEWLGGQGLRPELEPYLRTIRQRPDLLVNSGTLKMAVEFQCANLNLKEYQKRTAGFLKLGIEPLWIVGGNRLKRSAGCFFQLSGFHWQFSMRNEKLPKLLFFCPDQKAFLVLEHLIPFLTNKTSASARYLPLQQTKWHDLTSSKSRSSYQLDAWKRNLLKFRTTPSRFLSKESKQIAALFYERFQIPLPFFPSEVFLPVPSGYIFAHPVYVWQGHLYLYLTTRSSFHMQSAVLYMDKLVQSKKLKLRRNQRETVVNAVCEYIQFLHEKGFLKKEEEVYYPAGPIFLKPRLAELLKRDERYFSE